MSKSIPMDVCFDRAMGALLGVAIGDAMGMPTQTLNREQILSTYGHVADFTAAVPHQPVSGGLAAGTITDDTEQSLLLARQLIENGCSFNEEKWARSLLAWEKDTHARGVNDLLGPSTKRAIDALLKGVPASQTGLFGTTNGAAMRITPIGISVPPEPLSRLVDAVEETCRVTHNTSEAIGSAAAVATVISAGVAGCSFEDAVPLALAAARLGERRGSPSTAGSMSARIEQALELAAHNPNDWYSLAEEIGTSVAAIESVPMAFAVIRLSGCDVWKAAVLSANIGDDTDTIGSIACAMAGATKGAAAIPTDKVKTVLSVNHLNLAPLVYGLLLKRNELTHYREHAL